MPLKLSRVVKALRAVVELESSPCSFVCAMQSWEKKEGNLALGTQGVGVNSRISQPVAGQGFIK